MEGESDARGSEVTESVEQGEVGEGERVSMAQVRRVEKATTPTNGIPREGHIEQSFKGST